ncbi:septation protein IspZ [Massilia sp. SR12]
MPTQNPYTPPTSNSTEAQSDISPSIGLWAGASLLWRVFLLQLIVAIPVALLMPRGDEFIRLKPSVIYFAMTLVLGISAFFSKPGILSHFWGNRLGWAAKCWRRAHWLLLAYYLTMAIGNIFLIFITTIDVWVQIKFYVPIVSLIATCLAAPQFMRNAI